MCFQTRWLLGVATWWEGGWSGDLWNSIKPPVNAENDSSWVHLVEFCWRCAEKRHGRLPWLMAVGMHTPATIYACYIRRQRTLSSSVRQISPPLFYFIVNSCRGQSSHCFFLDGKLYTIKSVFFLKKEIRETNFPGKYFWLIDDNELVRRCLNGMKCTGMVSVKSSAAGPNFILMTKKTHWI